MNATNFNNKVFADHQMKRKSLGETLNHMTGIIITRKPWVHLQGADDGVKTQGNASVSTSQGRNIIDHLKL